MFGEFGPAGPTGVTPGRPAGRTTVKRTHVSGPVAGSGRRTTPLAGSGPALPTASGWWVFATGSVLVTAGWGAGFPEPVALGLACVATVVVAVLWVLPGPGMAFTREVTSRQVCRGDPAPAVLTVVRGGARVPRGLRLVDGCGTGVVTVPLPAPVPPRHGSGTTAYALPTHRRGRLQVGPLTATVTDPWGLARRVHRFGDAQVLLVRPRSVVVPPPPSGVERHASGAVPHQRDGGSWEFRSLREYVPGDDPRLVHWRATARTGRLMVRQTADVGRPGITVLLDTVPEHYPSTRAAAEGEQPRAAFELAVEVCASVLCAAARSGSPFRLLTDQATVDAGQREGGAFRGLDEVLDVLAVVDLSAAASPGGPGGGVAGADGAGVLLPVRGHATGQGTLVVVTGVGGGAVLPALTGGGGPTFDQVLTVECAEPGLPGGAGRGGSAAGFRGVRVTDLDAFTAAWAAEVAR